MVSLLVLCLAMGVLVSVYSTPCPNDCNQKGRCHSPGMVCKCFDGYTGGDCSELTCPFGDAWTDPASGVDLAHQPAECSNMGSCDRITGQCLCREGWEGNACERKSCPSTCSNVGKCQSMYYFAQTKDPGSGKP